MVAFADLILPDTTYLERHDCISLLDRPICEADAAADAIRWPVIEPDRECARFPDGADPARQPDEACRTSPTRTGTPSGRITPTTSSTTSASRASARWQASAVKTATRKAAAK